jgi:hypothetical protein
MNHQFDKDRTKYDTRESQTKFCSVIGTAKTGCGHGICCLAVSVIHQQLEVNGAGRCLSNMLIVANILNTATAKLEGPLLIETRDFRWDIQDWFSKHLDQVDSVYDITINVTERKVIEALSMYYRVPTMPAAIERLVTLVLE